jgi:hypothetical protein
MATDSASLSHNLTTSSQDEADAALERRIECARLAMTIATDEMSRRDHLTRMESLIAKRSPQQRERMEAKLPKKWGTK